MTEKIRPELIDELLNGATTPAEIFGRDGLLKKLTGAIVERVLKTELTVHLEREREGQLQTADDGERPARNRKNGSSKKTLQTEQGAVEIDVPRDRNSSFEPLIVPKHAVRIPGLDDKILALYARGLSTRDIQDELRELYATDVSPMLISRVTDAVAEEISDWRSRPLDPVYAVVWLDAIMVKMRDKGVVQARAVHIAIGMTREGNKQVLGMWVENNEGAKFWMRVLAELRSRGVRDILIACCDGLKGFPAAIQAVFPETTVQTCVVHQVRHSLSFVSWQERKELASELRAIYAASSEEQAKAELDAFEEKRGKRYPMIVRSWRANWETLAPFFAFGEEIRRMIYTTNAIESLNYQLRKVIKTKGHFPNEEAAIKLMFLALRNAEKRWKGVPTFWQRARAQLIAHFGEERFLAS